jgi:carboxyl-terminal processing protease
MIFPLFCFFAQPSTVDVDQALKRFTQVLAVVQTEAADPVNSEQAVYQGAIPGMLRRLDPHSIFFDPDQFQQLQEMERSERKGFGTVVSVLPGRVVILQALPGTPSAKAGLSAGDEIIAVNNVALARLEFDQLIGYLTEARQHTAKLIVHRPSNVKLLEFVLDPALVDAPSVDRAFFLQPGVGYIRVTGFDPQTGRQLKQAIEKLGGDKLKGLVLDLRNNPGGVVQGALESASYFLKPGQTILSVRGRSVESQTVEVPKDAKPYTFPLSVLLNEKTASASEILSGALQDHDRATIVGVPSYGKGLVQNVFNLTGKTAVALTTAFYYTPSGRSIQKPLESGQLDFAVSKQEYKTDSGRVVAGGGGIRPDLVVPPAQPNRLRVALDVSGDITSFATVYTQKHKVDDTFTPTPAILEDFQLYAAERGIQPSVGEWVNEREWVMSRLQQEIFNQSLGVEQGDEVEARRDVQVKAAVQSLKIAPE